MNFSIFIIHPDIVTWRQVLGGITEKCRILSSVWTAVSSTDSRVYGSFSWQTADCLSEEALIGHCDKENTDLESQDTASLQHVADRLHDAADNLPAYGCLVDVFLWLPQKTETSDYILLLGALRRLKDWHNAKVTIFDRDPSPDTEFLQKFLSAVVCFEDKFESPDDHCILWRGKMAVCDKIENKGITVPGISLSKLTGDTPDLEYPLPHSHQTVDIGDGCHCLLGRMLEVLDEVNLSTVPAIFTTDIIYKLSLYQKHPHAQVFMNYIQNSAQTGLLTRLAVYPKSKKLPVCGDTNLSTNSWKENIMADIQFVQEPEEDYQDNYEFLYFIVTSPDQTSSTESFTAHAYLLRSPYHLSGNIAETIYEQMLMRHQEGHIAVDIDKLPMLSSERLKKIHTDITYIQNSYLQDLLESRKKKNLPTVVDISELNLYLTEIRQKFLSQLSSVLPILGTARDTSEIQLQKITTEVSLNTLDWAERQIQQYAESQRRSLSRIRSTESMPMSSPIQDCDTTRTIDIQDFLRYFNPDGSAAADNLSPVRRPASGRAHGRKSHLSANDTRRSGLSDGGNSDGHDVYYNTSRKCERVNDHLNKLRDKWVKDDTSSSCTSGQLVFPKPSKQKNSSSENTELRRSPRKKAPRTGSEENIPHSQKSGNIKSRAGRLSDSSTPLSTIQAPESRRRFSTPHPVNSHSISFSQPSSSHQLQGARRRSEVGLSQSGTPLPRQVKKLRRESDAGIPGSTPQSQPVRTESRSERHKRKLQEIVDQVLKDSGVDRDDPIFQSCSTRLFKVTKLFVMDLPTSRNLKQEMKKIAENQVKQVIEVDRARRKSQDMKK